MKQEEMQSSEKENPQVTVDSKSAKTNRRFTKNTNRNKGVNNDLRRNGYLEQGFYDSRN